MANKPRKADVLAQFSSQRKTGQVQHKLETAVRVVLVSDLSPKASYGGSPQFDRLQTTGNINDGQVQH
jgi:hypothetical protein